MTRPLAVTGIVLAGGRSSRFGSDKLAAEFEGRPLLHHAIGALATLCEEIVVVVGPEGAPSLPDDLAGRLRVVRDPESFGGPLVGLGAGLAEAAHPVALVVGGDMPRLSADVLALLLQAVATDHDQAPPAAILEIAGEHLQPLPMALRVEPALIAFERIVASGGRALHRLLDALEPTVVGLAAWRAMDQGGDTILDVDRPSDLPG